MEFIKKMINFEKMITPAIIKFIYAGSTILIALTGILNLFRGATARYGGGLKVLSGLFLIAIAPFITRIACESMMVIFNINKNIQKLAEGINEEEA